MQQGDRAGAGRGTARAATLLRGLATAQLCWLAWHLAQSRVSPGDATGPLPASAGGIALQLVNPAAWLGGFAQMQRFALSAPPALQIAALIAISVITFAHFRTIREEEPGAAAAKAASLL